MENLNVSGIYTITNIINGKILVGYGKNIRNRLKWHKSLLRNNKHKNTRIQNSWNKYGENSFLFEKLVECKEDHLASEEHYWAIILKTNDRNFGFNIRPTHPYDVKVMSEETKQKISLVSKGKKLSEKHKEKISLAHKGKVLTEIQLQTLKNNNEKSKSETLKKVKEIKIRKMSDKQKQRLSEIKTGQNNPAKWIPILQFDLGKNFIERFDNISLASQKTNVCIDSIRRQCKRNSIGKETKSPKVKYNWWYEKDYKSQLNN